MAVPRALSMSYTRKFIRQELILRSDLTCRFLALATLALASVFRLGSRVDYIVHGLILGLGLGLWGPRAVVTLCPHLKVTTLPYHPGTYYDLHRTLSTYL